jgi:hypothetical protein
MSENQACVANITAAGRRRRTTTGVVVLAATAIVHLAWVRELAAPWTLATIVPLAFGWLCVFQALDDT